MKSITIFILSACLFACINALGQTNRNQECRCSCATTEPFIRTAEQGRPGKIGPPGPPGPMGLVGAPGSCGCDPNEIERLNSTIQTLLGEIKVLSTTCVRNQHLIPQFFVQYCSVGMKYGDSKVANSHITASSYYSGNYLPAHGRLDYPGVENPHRWAAWAAQTNQIGEWIQVDLEAATFVTGVITQGRGDTFSGVQYVSSYKIAYGNTTNNIQEIIRGNGDPIIFSGNTDTNSYVMNRFPQPITARYFWLIVQSWQTHASLRMDYITC